MYQTVAIFLWLEPTLVTLAPADPRCHEIEAPRHGGSCALQLPRRELGAPQEGLVELCFP